MFVTDAPFVHEQLDFLQGHRKWRARWRDALVESRIGRPLRHPRMLKSSGNLISKVYEVARFEDLADEITGFSSIIEIGGGYGATRRLMARLGFRGRYVMFDLPEMLCLARYYLRENASMGATSFISDVRSLGDLMEELPHPQLVIATWSLSEMPLDLRAELEEIGLSRSPDGFLMGYQTSFRNLDNRSYFGGFMQQRSDLRWHVEPIPVEPDNVLLVGCS